jgi:DNA-directed RNA polymerase subunit L
MTSKDFIHDKKTSNDKIDIYKTPKMQVEDLEDKNSLKAKIRIYGNSIDSVIVNTIRRSLDSIPIYAYNRNNIMINNKRNKTMYNSDMIKCQFEQLTIPDIDNDFDLQNPEIFLPTMILREMFSDYVSEIHEEETPEEEIEKRKLKKIEFSIDYKNEKEDFHFLSTHDGVLKIDGKISNNYLSRNPIDLLVVKKGEEISLHAEANLGIAQMHASYEAVAAPVFIQNKDDDYTLKYESLGQLHKHDIFTKSCLIIKKKLELFREYCEKNLEDRDPREIIVIEVLGEDHTLGNLIASVLKKSEHTDGTSGYKMPHPFDRKIVISFKIADNSKIKPIQFFIDCLSYLIKVFSKLSRSFLTN